MNIKTIHTQGLSPSHLHIGMGLEPGQEVGGDQGIGLVDPLERELWAILLESHKAITMR